MYINCKIRIHPVMYKVGVGAGWGLPWRHAIIIIGNNATFFHESPKPEYRNPRQIEFILIQL